jgi:SprT protein
LIGFLNKRPKAVIENADEKFRILMEKTLPPAAVDYTLDLWKNNPFNFKITRKRQTCLGNYTKRNQQHFITINVEPNKYAFLITLIHEIAHQHLQINYAEKARFLAPHGVEWKKQFINLMTPLLNSEVFPNDLLQTLKLHFKNPAASSTRDPQLVKALAQYSLKSNNEENSKYLSELPSGIKFEFNGAIYKKIEDRRSRTLVESVFNKKKYTIPSHAIIKILNPGNEAL